MKILHYKHENYQELWRFYTRMFPQNSEDYFYYQLYQTDRDQGDNSVNYFVIADDGNIVGCRLCFTNKALIRGIEQKIYWGHNTIVQEEYRGEIGAAVLLESFKIKNSFGCGLSIVNEKIQKKFKKSFFAPLTKYLTLNLYSYKIPLLICGFNCNSKKIEFPSNITVRGRTFKRINNPSELNIPHNGYWNKGEFDVEFIRDEIYLKHRFFDNNLNDYYLYVLEDHDINRHKCYFVVRVIKYHKITTLSLVDFRLDYSDKGQYDMILKCINKLALLNHIPLLLSRTTLIRPALSLFPLTFKAGKTNTIVGDKEYRNFSIFVTAADSDTDFLDSFQV